MFRIGLENAIKTNNMGFEVIGMLLAGAAMASLGFYMVQFIVEVVMGKYRSEE